MRFCSLSKWHPRQFVPDDGLACESTPLSSSCVGKVLKGESKGTLLETKRGCQLFKFHTLSRRPEDHGCRKACKQNRSVPMCRLPLQNLGIHHGRHTVRPSTHTSPPLPQRSLAGLSAKTSPPLPQRSLAGLSAKSSSSIPCGATLAHA